jgi:hypothetical protein
LKVIIFRKIFEQVLLTQFKSTTNVKWNKSN